jgi:hypothetical protein
MITNITTSARTTNLLNIANANTYNILVDGDAKTIKVLESLSISCGNTNTDVTIVITKGGTDYYLWNAVTLTANTVPKMLTPDYPHHLRLDSTMKLRIKASNANQITAIAITFDAPPVQAMSGGLGSVAGNY